MSAAKIPPYSAPLGTPDPEEEWLFPEGFPVYDPETDLGVQVSNPDAAEWGGYLDRHLANVRGHLCSRFRLLPKKLNARGSRADLPGGAYQILANYKKARTWRAFSTASVSALLFSNIPCPGKGICAELSRMRHCGRPNELCA